MHCVYNGERNDTVNYQLASYNCIKNQPVLWDTKLHASEEDKDTRLSALFRSSEYGYSGR